MSMGSETVRTIPLQRVFTARKSHDHEGVRLIALLGANAVYDSGIIQISGNTDIEIFNQADQTGTVYIYLGVDPTVLLAKVIGEETVKSAYDPAGPGSPYIQRCSAEYARVVYVNDNVAQGEWEFSVQIRPIGK